VIADEDPFGHLDLFTSEHSNLKLSNVMEQSLMRTSACGDENGPSEAELRNYVICLEILGVDERADIETIQEIHQHQIKELQGQRVNLATSQVEQAEDTTNEQELEIVLRH
jgi:hypothetical protein